MPTRYTDMAHNQRPFTGPKRPHAELFFPFMPPVKILRVKWRRRWLIPILRLRNSTLLVEPDADHAPEELHGVAPMAWS